MRTSRFTFKKTIKRNYKAISVDMTVNEAKALAEIIHDGTDYHDEGGEEDPVSFAMHTLFESLKDFVEANGQELELL